MASKQNIVKHVKRFHPDSDPSETISKVQISQQQEQNPIVIPKPKKAAKKKKKAYQHFSQLSNIFNNNDMIEQFSISKSKKTLACSSIVAPALPPVLNTTSITGVIDIDVSPGVDVDMQISPARSVRQETDTLLCQSRTGQPGGIQTLSDRDRFDLCDESRANDDVVPVIDIDSFFPFPDIHETDRILDVLEASPDSTFNLLFRGSDVCDQRQFSTQRHFLAPTSPVLSQHGPPLSSQADSVVETSQMLEKSPLMETSFRNHRSNNSSYMQDITLTPPSPAQLSIPNQFHVSLAGPSHPPVLRRRDCQLACPTDSVQPTHGVQHRTFTVPYNTRGHCGLQGCVGCNREPCGTCQHCIHKKEKTILLNYMNVFARIINT